MEDVAAREAAEASSTDKPAGEVRQLCCLRLAVAGGCEQTCAKGRSNHVRVVAIALSPQSEGGAAKEEGAGGSGGGAAAAADAAAAAAASAAPEDPKVAERRAADADRAARRRMLGNIQFISYLYKNGLLTER